MKNLGEMRRALSDALVPGAFLGFGVWALLELSLPGIPDGLPWSRVIGILSIFVGTGLFASLISPSPKTRPFSSQDKDD